MFKRARNWLEGGRKWNEGLFTYVPFTLLPYTRKPLLDRVWVAKKQVDWSFPNLLSRLRARGPFDAFFVGDPRFVPLVGRVEARSTIFRITDDVMGFSGTPRSLEGFLKTAAIKCDRAVATSAPLREKLLREFGFREVLYMPNGVEYDHFAGKTHKEPEDLKIIPRPRALYVGVLRDWFDLDCLTFCASRLSDVSFVVIGPSELDLRSLSRFPNVYYLGPRPYNDVPDYMAFSQVGIIPFKREERTDSVSSIKLLQYLAAGLPSVCTLWKELELLKAPVRLALDKMEFANLIRDALREEPDREKLRSFAHSHTWKENADVLLRMAAPG